MKLHHLALAAALAFLSPEPAVANEGATPPKAFLAVRVSDVEAAALWYASTFDMKVANRFSTSAYEMRILDGDRAIVELIQLKSPMPPPDAAALGFIKGGFTIDDFDAAVARWRASGVSFRGRIIYNDRLKLHVAGLSDPDGNIVQIFGRSARPQRTP